MSIRVYYIPGSHPCNAVFKALDLKGLDYKKVVVIPPAHRLQMKLMFGSRTVPAIKYTDASGTVEKVQTTRAIFRMLDSLVPEPRLFPAAQAERDRVIAAETWADGNFQDVGRRLTWAHLRRSPQAMLSYSTGDRVPLPAFVQSAAAKPVAAIQAALNKADDERVRRDLAELPEMLDKIDGYIADGVIGGESPNAADLQIAATLNLWMSMDDLRDAIEQRPCGQLTRRIFPAGETHGHVQGGILPADWLAPVRQATPSAV
ncbi:MAG: glutathione S-transferase [Actinobacteria bacterium]|nr:glutathione S-transferase [Actinomycetota bacterium]